MEFFLSFRIRFADLPRMRCCLPAVERRIRPPPVALNRFAAARLVFILGILLSSLESSQASGNRGQGAENAGSSAPPQRVKQIGDRLPLEEAFVFGWLRDQPRISSSDARVGGRSPADGPPH
jgi:hypothetical protein